MEDIRKTALLQNKRLIVGVDIAKMSHCATLMENNKKTHKGGIWITNNLEGFDSFAARLAPWDPKEVIIGMEPTGHYWKALYWYLQPKGYTIVLTNPFHVKSSKEIYDNHRSKNDVKDSRLIAHLVAEGKFLEHVSPEGSYGELRHLTHVREQKMIDLCRSRIRLVALLDEYLPEFHQNFKDVTRVSLLLLLKTYGLQGLRSEKDIDQKIAFLRLKSRSAISQERAERVIKAFSQSIGVSKSIESAEITLELILGELELFKNHIDMLEAKIEAHVLKTSESKHLLTIKGIGVITAGILLGQIGSLSSYRHPRQIEKLAGILLSENSSGQHKGKVRISRRGKKLLRCTLFRLAVSLVCNNEEFKKMYKHKKETLKKTGRSALVSLAVKFLKIMFYIIKGQQSYDSNRVLEGLAKA